MEVERVVYMNEENIKTFSMCAFFVFLFCALGFLIASIVNIAKVYIETYVVEAYYAWVKIQMFASKYLPYYLLTGILFACVGLFIIYSWNFTDST